MVSLAPTVSQTPIDKPRNPLKNQTFEVLYNCVSEEGWIDKQGAVFTRNGNINMASKPTSIGGHCRVVHATPQHFIDVPNIGTKTIALGKDSLKATFKERA